MFCLQWSLSMLCTYITGLSWMTAKKICLQNATLAFQPSKQWPRCLFADVPNLLVWSSQFTCAQPTSCLRQVSHSLQMATWAKHKSRLITFQCTLPSGSFHNAQSYRRLSWVIRLVPAHKDSSKNLQIHLLRCRRAEHTNHHLAL